MLDERIYLFTLRTPQEVWFIGVLDYLNLHRDYQETFPGTFPCSDPHCGVGVVLRMPNSLTSDCLDICHVSGLTLLGSCRRLKTE